MEKWNKAIEAITKSDKKSSVYIGCDSIRYKVDGKWKARYSTVVILHRASRNGANLFYDTVTLDDYGNLKMRLMNEVMFAIEAASAVVDHLDGRSLEIHIDINADPKHASNVAVKEALGYVRGSGFEARIKPHSFAATHASDHVARGKLH